MKTISFFICGLPRTRSAWVANYLTYGDTYCIHDGLKDCVNGVENLPRLAPDFLVLGNSDPANALVQDQLIKEFPAANWVIVERPFKDVAESIRQLEMNSAQLHVVQTKLEELRAKVNPLVVSFDSLNDSIVEIAQHVNPNWRHPKQRHEFLVNLNVQLDAEHGKAEIKRRGDGIKHLVEAPTIGPMGMEYYRIVEELCSPDAHAFMWFKQALNTALVWDHVVDGDALDFNMFDAVMQTLVTEWPINPFLKKYGEYIVPTLASAISSWKYSYQEGAFKEHAYAVYTDVPASIAFVLGGNQRVAQFMPRINELVYNLKALDDKKDGGRK